MDSVYPKENQPKQLTVYKLTNEQYQSLEPYLQCLMRTSEEQVSVRIQHQRYLLALILYDIQQAIPLQPTIYSNGRTFETRLLEEIVAYISNNYQKKLTINSLSERFFISPSTLNRYFHRNYGISLGEFLKTVRLTNARKYLAEGYSIQETGNLYGFSSTSYFIKVFREKIEKTPAQYLQQYKKFPSYTD